jgi:polyisoprenoid-binding protein YceI
MTKLLLAALFAATSAAGAQTVFQGQLPIRRLAFQVGEGEWQDTSAVADEVIIKFRIVAQR